MSNFSSDTSKSIIQNIRRRFAADNLPQPNRVKYSSQDYEEDISTLLDDFFPYSWISGLRLFSPTNRLNRELGFEMDNLMHLRLGGTDFIVIVEAKKQRVIAKNSRWEVTYDNQVSCAKRQMENHIKTLWEYLEPISRDIDLKFVAFVCCPELPTPARAEGYRGSKLVLTEIAKLPELLDQLFHFSEPTLAGKAEVLRVAQSPFLDILRLNLPVPELGHPELASAIRYVDRCRRALDESLFLDFSPTLNRWAINGSAGMGKSVLLAYAAAVFCSGYELKESLGDIFPVKADDLFSKIKFERERSQGTICLMAMSSKQLLRLREWFDFFAKKYQELDAAGLVRFRQPEFLLCRDAEQLAAASKRCAALVVDEAHDLPSFASKVIAEGHEENGFYLLVACDRHQRLRLAGSDARIVEGVDFTLRSKRLRQIYRNSAPIYIASLALMFRWFAKEGPKVVPTQAELRDCFGFEVTSLAGNGYSCSMMGDAHPANSWCHTVASFPNAGSAYLALERERMGYEDVLWVRFSEEDPDFDYEKLRNFTYHNCRTSDSQKLCDKYVKGQEYSIVVIEGFPSFMDRYEPSENGTATEPKMWSFRREVYLCASRATCFLYFVFNPRGSTPEISRMRDEFSELVSSVSLPSNRHGGGAKRWSFLLKETSEKRNLDVFTDTVVEEVSQEAATALPTPENKNQVEPSQNKPTTLPKHPAKPQPEPTAAAVGARAGTEKSADTPREATSKQAQKPPTATPALVRLSEPVVVKDLAKALNLRSFMVIADLMEINIFAGINQALERDIVSQVCSKHGARFEPIHEDEATSAAETREPEILQAADQEKNCPLPVLDLISKPEARDGGCVSNEAPAFRHKIQISGPTSVIDLSKQLGIRHKDVMIEATRLGVFTRGQTILSLDNIKRIAAKHGFAIELIPEK